MQDNRYTGQDLYISDLDGTLLDASGNLSSYTAGTLTKLISEGLCFSVATARLLPPTRKLLADVALSIPIILMNGVLIYDTQKERYIKVHKLSHDTAAAVVDEIRAHKVTGFLSQLGDDGLRTYHEEFAQHPPSHYVRERIDRYFADYRHTNGFPGAPLENAIFFTMIDVYERLRPIADALAAYPDLNRVFYRNIYCPDLWYLQVFSAKASKQTAVAHLRETFGFARIVCFGDNDNDLPMFAACDIRVAVANATPEVKVAADFLCGTNEEDGVAKWLEKNARIRQIS